MKAVAVFIAVLTTGLMLACASQPKMPYQVPINTYTPTTTLAKVKTQFPQASLPEVILPEGIDKFDAITYKTVNGHQLQMDIYAPASTHHEARPTILLVHGGGWRSGERDNMQALAHKLSLRGYVAATISYRLADEAKYPAAIEDLHSAIRFLREHAKQYGIDGQRLVIAGGSAGGQMAALTGLTAGNLRFDPEAKHSLVDTKVQAIVNIDGLSDFTSAEALKYEDDPSKKPSAAGFWFGGTYAEQAALWQEASPLFYISEQSPSILFIRSSQSRFSLGYEQVVEKLNILRIRNHVETFHDAPHSFWILDPWVVQTANLIANYLDAQFAYKMNCH